MTLHTSLQTVK